MTEQVLLASLTDLFHGAALTAAAACLVLAASAGIGAARRFHAAGRARLARHAARPAPAQADTRRTA